MSKTMIQVHGTPMVAVVTQMKDTGRYVASLDTKDTTALASGDTAEEAADNLAFRLAGK